LIVEKLPPMVLWSTYSAFGKCYPGCFVGPKITYMSKNQGKLECSCHDSFNES